MKNLVKNLVLFVGLALTISVFTACESQVKKGSSEKQVDESTKGQDLNADKPEEGDKKDDDSDKESDDKTVEKKPTSVDYPPAPKAIATADIELTNGETFNIAEQKDKVILVNLWAIWCGPCIKEMPHLNELNELYGDKGLVLIGLNTGNEIGEKENKPNIERFIAKQNLNYPIGYSHRKLTTEFFRLGQMNGIPQSFLIDKQGKLRGIFQGGSMKVVVQMKEVVEKLMNES